MRYAAPMVCRDAAAEAWRVEIVHEEKSISRLWIVDRRMRIGAAVVRTAGIAGVGTNPEHRERGLSMRVLRRSLELMNEQGYDASLLYGIQDFYHRVGFATCFPEHGLSVDTRQAERAVSRLRTRPMRDDDLGTVRSLYERGNVTRTGAAVRGRRWKGFARGSDFGVPAQGHVVCAPGATRRVLGYLLLDDVADRCRVAEVGGEGDEVYGAILRHLGQRAVELRRERISMSLPGDHPFAVYCRRYGYQDETRYPRNAGPMGRSLELKRFCTAMLPEWRRLWPDGAPTRMPLRVGNEAVTLQRSGDELRVSAGAKGAGASVTSPGALMQLAMGFRTADDALAAGQLAARGARAELARALFPLRVGHMWWPDRF